MKLEMDESVLRELAMGQCDRRSGTPFGVPGRATPPPAAPIASCGTMDAMDENPYRAPAEDDYPIELTNLGQGNRGRRTGSKS